MTMISHIATLIKRFWRQVLKLKKKEKGRHPGIARSEWAERITPHMNVEHNGSPSFRYFRRKLRELVAAADE